MHLRLIWLFLVSMIWSLTVGCDRDPTAEAVARILSPATRPTVGRWISRRPYRPYSSRDLRPAAPISELRCHRATRIVRALERRTHTEEGPDALSEHGLAGLALVRCISRESIAEQVEAALTSLELAAQRLGSTRGERGEREAARVWNGLAVGYLSLHEINDDPIDLLRAARAGEQAEAFLPGLPEVAFNRALALTKLHLRHEATAAWARFRALESNPYARREARERARTLEREHMLERWARQREVLEEATGLSAAGPTSADIGTGENFAAGDPSDEALRSQAKAAVHSFPFHASKYVRETLLPRWAADKASGEDARAGRTLQLIAALAAALLEQRGEGHLHDAVLALRAVETGGDAAARHRLRSGLGLLGEGLSAYGNQDTERAEALLARAARDLDAAGNPMAGWALFYRAIAVYYDSVDEGLKALTELEERLRTDPAAYPDDPGHDGDLEPLPARYGLLAGRVQWLLGTANMVQGRVQTGLGHYQRAQRLLERSGGEGISAFTHVLVAEIYSLLGEHRRGWQERRTAYREVPYIEGPLRTVAMLTESAISLNRQGALELAGPLLDEAVALAEEAEQPAGLTTAYQQRAVYRLAVGAREGAAADLRQAREASERMKEGGLRTILSTYLVLTEGLHALAVDPARAVDLLDEALSSQLLSGYRFAEIDYRGRKAEAHLRLGDVAGGERELLLAVRLYETIRSTVEDPVSKMRAFHQAQAAFELLIDLRARAGDEKSAFRFSEQARARVLLDLANQPENTKARPKPHDEPTWVSPGELSSLLPPEVVVAAFTTLEARTLAWIIDRSMWRMIEIPVEASELASAIQRFRLELERRSPERRLQASGGELYDLLIKPLGLSASDTRTLIVIPDEALAGLELATLYNRAASRYLIQERALSLVPSATLLALSLQRQSPPDAPQRVLAVGVGDAYEAEGITLPALAEVEGEARRVAARYPGSRLLLGGEATRENFLAASVFSTMIHVAGHTLTDPVSPRRSALILHQPNSALASSALLTLEDLFATGFDQAQLVVLSACRTVDSLAEEREALLGLAGVIFGHGVPAVVASQRDAGDKVTATLMDSFHREIARGLPAAQALRLAILDLLASDRRSLRSPASWGRYSVVGGLGN